MDVIGVMRRVNRIGIYFLLTVILLNLVGIVFAGGVPPTLTTALENLCQTSRTFLAAAIMIMIILAGATYAIGQMLGAETRARASVWATAMLTGAIIGALIYLIVPLVLSTLLAGQGITITTGGDPCTFSSP